MLDIVEVTDILLLLVPCLFSFLSFQTSKIPMNGIAFLLLVTTVVAVPGNKLYKFKRLRTG